LPALTSRPVMSAISRAAAFLWSIRGKRYKEIAARTRLETDHQLLSGCREDMAPKVKGGEEAHDRARRQRPARQEPPRLPLANLSVAP
jgi:hypothetical protein